MSNAKTVEKGDKQAPRDRLTVYLPKSLSAKLEPIMEQTHAQSVSELIKNALLYYSHLVEEESAGRSVYVIDKVSGTETRYPMFTVSK